MVLWLALTGCAFLSDKYEGITNSLVTQGLVMGVMAPETGDVDLSSSGFDEGVVGNAFLADTTQVTDLENAPIEGATVSLQSASFTEAGAGNYVLTPGGLAWAQGQTWTLAVSVEGADPGAISFETQAPVTATVPDQHTKNTPMTVDLTGQGYTSALIVVVDASGAVTFNNQPTSIREVYDLTRGTVEVTTVEIPGAAFPGDTVYLVGIAGMNHTVGDDISGMNDVLSAALFGVMKWFPTATVEIPA